MSLLKQINEGVSEVKGDEVAARFRKGLKDKHNITVSDDAFRAFMKGGDDEEMGKFVDDLEKAGFDTAGGFEENAKFLKDMGIGKTQWYGMAKAFAESYSPFAVREIIKDPSLIGEMEGKCGGKKPEDEEGGFSKQQMADMKKLVSQYVQSETPLDQVSDMAGDDLEMLEYSPEEIDMMVPAVVKLMKDHLKK